MITMSPVWSPSYYSSNTKWRIITPDSVIYDKELVEDIGVPFSTVEQAKHFIETLSTDYNGTGWEIIQWFDASQLMK